MIKYLPLQQMTAMCADEIHQAVSQVIDSGWYLKGEATAVFEQHYADYIGAKCCVGVGNGLDALTLILRAYMEMGCLQVGDEVIVPANTYIASILAITECGLQPVLVEPDMATLQIDENRLAAAVTERTRAVMIVHLYGICAYTDRIGEICRQHQLLLIEDNAQAHGCCFNNKRTGALGHAAGHSFYPSKNLGALGDGGAVTTDSEELAECVRSLANYGSSRRYVFDYKGRNSRLDEIQAAVLDVKLKYLDQWNRRRKQIADLYIRNVRNRCLTTVTCSRDSVWHIFPVLTDHRDALQQYLAEEGVETQIHYPIPPHRQRCYAAWNDCSYPVTERIHQQELSIPCHPAMTDADAEKVVRVLNSFCL